MKRFVLFIVLMALCASGWSQTQSVNFEIFGSSGMAGVNYDARFKDNYGFGFSVGIGYGYANRSYDFLETRGNDGVTHFIGAPVEINYLLGQRNSHFVLGAGAMA